MAGLASCGVTARFFGAVFVADFLADFLTAFFATFLADFFAAFFGAFFAAFFEALPAFFTPRLLVVILFLAARFFAAAFLLALADGDLRAFFVLRFFEAFFPAVATTNSFMTQRLLD
ncbi:hypothetical protein [Bradyrhizobium sp. CCBAU 051011]|uniref:hypothetical protein n=1 Tax=Bradyrhizobium sp. CCBAU 051011 TaxID=858422 RepID=UPI001FEF6F18|nr:hypothetical protein [Bradyrhizobium sp. CCBAU 051011]